MAVADKVSVVLAWSLQLRYQMLDRMKQDCEYFLGHGNGPRSIFVPVMWPTISST